MTTLKNFRNKNDIQKIEGKTFDKKNIHFIRKGQKINVYDFIQSGREDTEIYPMIEKYGIIKTNKDLEKPLLYGEFTELQNLRDVQEKMILADNLWDRMSLEQRKFYHNNKMEFVRYPTKYADFKKEQLQNIRDNNNTLPQETKPTTGEDNK